MSELDRLISASRLRLRLQSPFLATLSLFARFVPTQALQMAGTDGKDIYFNADFLRSLPPAQQDGLLLHALLHAALLHVPRRGNRDAKLWNAAADIVVNGTIAACDRCQLPPGALRDPQLERFSVEEIYVILQQRTAAKSSSEPDLLEVPPEPADRPDRNAGAREARQDNKDADASDPEAGNCDRHNLDNLARAAGPAERAAVPPGPQQKATEARHHASLPSPTNLETYWRNAIEQAKTVARASDPSEIPANIQRDLATLAPSQLDWRGHLWRYFVQTPVDFQGYDRRFIGQGLYLDTLRGESLAVFIAVDTSGSIDDRLLAIFLGEVRGILAAYPHIQGQLYYTDARAYGPYPLGGGRDRARPIGGGGTSFVPFFERVAAQAAAPGSGPWQRSGAGICVYFTDGYGTFPETPPEFPVLWVVAPGGRAQAEFPFGEVTLLDCGG